MADDRDETHLFMLGLSVCNTVVPSIIQDDTDSLKHVRNCDHHQNERRYHINPV